MPINGGSRDIDSQSRKDTNAKSSSKNIDSKIQISLNLTKF